MSSLPVELPESVLPLLRPAQYFPLEKYSAYKELVLLLEAEKVLYAVVTRRMTPSEEVALMMQKVNGDWATLPLSDKISVLILVTNEAEFEKAQNLIDKDYGYWIGVSSEKLAQLTAGV